MKEDTLFLTCKKVKFFSLKDEDLFFEWIKKIKSIQKFDGEGYELYLYFESNNISNEDIRELLALFQRYKIDMKQLKVFMNDSNKHWLKWQKCI